MQFPAVAAAIAIPYNNANVSGTLALTRDQVCKVFSGQFTNWNQLGAYPSKTIKVIYRSDGSGTTFSFANYLNTVCTQTPSSLPAGSFFTADQTFTVAAGTAGFTPVPANGASGNPGVVNLVGATDGAIGYAETSDSVNRSPALKLASVNGKLPTSATDFPSPFPVSIASGKVVTVSAVTGQATLANVTGGAHTTCLVTVDPTSYANPGTGYPIVGVSYLLSYYSGNPNKTDLLTVLKAPYALTVTNIASGKGLVNLKDNATGVRMNLSTTIDNCVF